MIRFIWAIKKNIELRLWLVGARERFGMFAVGLQGGRCTNI